MGVKCISWALEQPIAGNEKCVLIVLANRARDEDGTCFPGQADVARQAYVSTKTVSRIEGKLEEAGYILRSPRFRDGQRTSDLIQLIVPWAPTDTLSADTGGGDQQTPVSERNPKREPSASEVARVTPAKPKPVSYRGKRVGAPEVQIAENLLGTFNEVFGRRIGARTGDGAASSALKQIIGALMERPEVGGAAWETAIRNTFENPPGWTDGRQIQLGDVFGSRAAEFALTNDGMPRRGNVTSGSEQPSAEDFARLALGEDG